MAPGDRDDIDVLTSLARLATIPQFVQAQLVGLAGLVVAIVTLALSDTLIASRVDVAICG